MAFNKLKLTRTVVSSLKFSTLIYLLNICEIKAVKNQYIVQTSYSKIVKSILLWTPFLKSKEYGFENGNAALIDGNCPISDCLVYDDRDSSSLDSFDAIVFYAPNYTTLQSDYPYPRSPNQRYVYFSDEPPISWQVDSTLNGFFNLTMTHRMDSDITIPAFNLVDAKDNIISPSSQPKWIHQVRNRHYLRQFSEIISTKSKPVAMIKDDKNSKSTAEYITKLRAFIQVELYADCGSMKWQQARCLEQVKKEYFFYLSFENYKCTDYVSDKVLYAIENNAVPIVYGGANYSSYLPPGSYIDATRHSPEELAQFINFLINNRDEYIEYFWWKGFYKVVRPVGPVCSLCKVLHSEENEPKVYEVLRSWWHLKTDKITCNAHYANITHLDYIE